MVKKESRINNNFKSPNKQINKPTQQSPAATVECLLKAEKKPPKYLIKKIFHISEAA